MCCQAIHLFVGERVPAMLAACNPDATVSEKKKKRIGNNTGGATDSSTCT